MKRSLTIEHLLAHPGNGGLRWLGGAPGHEIEALSLPEVLLLTDAAALPGARASGDGALIVFTGPAPAESWQVEALLRRVRSAGHRGVVFGAPTALGAGTLAVARRLGLGLLEARAPLQLARAAWELQEGQDALTLGYVRRVAQSIEYYAQNLQDLLRHLAASVGHGVALMDAEGVLVEAGRPLPAGLHAALRSESWAHTASVPDGAGASVRVESPSREGLRLAVSDAALSPAQLSALVVAAEVAMPAVAARLLIDEVSTVNNASIDSGLVRDFLEQPGGPHSEIGRRMLERGWRTGGAHLGFRLVGRSRLTPLELLRSASRLTAQWGLDAHVVTAGLGLIGWISFPETPPRDTLERHIAHVRELHRQLRRSFDIATGLGTVENGAEGLAASIDAAGEAARVASHREGTGFFVRIDALGLEQLLLSRTENDTFLPAAASLLRPLVEAGGELLPTLSAFLDHESSTSAAASALGLHRNTVASRIDRARDLLGLDLSDPDTRLALHLALRALSR